MIHAIHNRLVLVALAALAGLVVAAAPAAATDDPAPRPVPQGGAPFGSPAAPVGVQAPATAHRKKRVAKKQRVRVHVRYRKHRKGVRVSLTGPGLRGVKRVEVLVNGRRIARDSARPFRLKLNGRKLGGSRKLQLRLVRSDGSVRTITRRLRSGKRGATAHRSAFESIATSISLNALLSRYGVV
jgi:hypothetical protein